MITFNYIPVGHNWRIAKSAEREWTASRKRGEVWSNDYFSSLRATLEFIVDTDPETATTLTGVIRNQNRIWKEIKTALEGM